MNDPVQRATERHLTGAVRDVASLDEKSVQKVARGEHDLPVPHHGRGPSKNSPVTRLQVRPEVMREVKKLHADPRHVQIVSTNEVIVWNHPAPWPERGPEHG